LKNFELCANCEAKGHKHAMLKITNQDKHLGAVYNVIDDKMKNVKTNLEKDLVSESPEFLKNMPAPKEKKEREPREKKERVPREKKERVPRERKERRNKSTKGEEFGSTRSDTALTISQPQTQE